MIKVMFLSWHYETPEMFLSTLIKMTPNRSGKWKNIEYTLDFKEADYYIIHDGWRGILPDAEKKAIYFGQHPYDIIGKGITKSYRTFKEVKCLTAFPLSTYLNPGDWWIDYDYDALIGLPNPLKRSNLACIMTYQPTKETYIDRIKFMEIFTPIYPEVDIYGRPSEGFKNNSILSNNYRGVLGNEKYQAYKTDHLTGKNILKDYRYSLEYDIGPTKNYICERFYDAILLWTMPIYYGSINTHKYLPENSFRYVNIENQTPEEARKVIDIVNSDFREQHIKDIAEARDLILNKYQTWAYTHDVVNNIEMYKEKNRGLLEN
jgi:hypothetical protein